MILKSSQKPVSLLGEFAGAYRLLTKQERRRSIAMAIMAIFSGLLDTVSLASTMPFIALLVDVDAAFRNRQLAAIHAALGSPTATQFVLIAGFSSFAIITAAGLVSLWLRRRTNRLIADCQSRLARDVMDALVNAPYSWFFGINTQTVSYVFHRDVLLWAREFVMKFINMTRDLALIVMPIALVLAVTPLVGVVTLAAIASIVAGVIFFSRPRITMLMQIKQDADAKAIALSAQALSAIKDVVISGRQKEFVDAFSRSYGGYAWAQGALQNQHQLPTSAILLLGQIGLLAVAIVLWAVGSDRGTLAAQMSLLVLVTSRIIPAANRLSSAITTFFSVLPAVRGIEGVLNEIRRAGQSGRETAGQRPVARPWQRVSFRNVGFSYPTGERPALIGISLELKAGRSYGVVGASGAGKSTFADLLMGFVAPNTGSIRIDGQPIEELSLASWRSRIGYVPQIPFVADTTLAANVAFGVKSGQVDQARLADAVELARLDRLVAELPNGLATNLGDRGIRLSGGQRQRVAIARAVYDECDLLVLDEATSALDSIVERDIAEAVHALAGRITLVIIAHRISTVVDCDEILVFDGGRVVATGPHAKLMTSCPQYQALVAGQTLSPMPVGARLAPNVVAG